MVRSFVSGAGDYGTWAGTDKAVTIRPQAGVSPTLCFDFDSSAANFTVDGGHTNYDSGSPGINSNPSCTNWFEAGSKNITVENMAFGECSDFCIDDRSEGPGIVIQGNMFHDMVYPNQSPGAIRVYKSGTDPSSTLINYNLFRDMGADGIDPGPGTTMIGNDFSNVNSDSIDPRHTDAIQFGSDDVIEGNFVHNGCVQGIDAFDGATGNTIQDNVIIGCTAHSLVTMADAPGSLVAHNTVIGAGGEECGSKTNAPSVTAIRDNILAKASIGAALSVRHRSTPGTCPGQTSGRSTAALISSQSPSSWAAPTRTRTPDTHWQPDLPARARPPTAATSAHASTTTRALPAFRDGNHKCPVAASVAVQKEPRVRAVRWVSRPPEREQSLRTITGIRGAPSPSLRVAGLCWLSWRSLVP